jgi:hypothetical protein
VRFLRDADHVEKVLDELRELHYLAIDRIGGARQLRVLGARLDQPGVGADCVDVVPQLVRQQGQELVLCPVGLLQLVDARLKVLVRFAGHVRPVSARVLGAAILDQSGAPVRGASPGDTGDQ